MANTAFSALSLRGEAFTIQIAAPPDQCPRCHHHIDPVWRFARFDAVFPTHGDLEVQAVYQCPRAECKQLFIALFEFPNRQMLSALNAMISTFKLKRTEPLSPKTQEFPAEITKVSPSFVRIFNQALAAEAYGLSDIAGPGYGKALEFLIKDFLVASHPEDAAIIKVELLGTVIRNRVSDPRIKDCAERGAWLRNDETHYERRWANKDIQDLKTVITLTVNWIHSSLLTDALIREMPKPTR